MSGDLMSFAEHGSGASSPRDGYDETQWVDPAVVVASRDVLRRIRERGGTSIGVTSARRGEGRTTVARGLALANWASLKRPTVLLDLGSGGAHRPDRRGLSDVLAGNISGVEAIEWVAPDLGVIPAGHSMKEAATGIGALRSILVLRDFETAGIDIVADLPPVSPAGIGDRLASIFSTMVLVVRAGRTPAEAVKRAAATLPQDPLVVLNGTYSSVPRWVPGFGGR